MIAWRGDKLRSPGRIDSAVSREAAFLLNNLLFAGFALVVLTGTVFPLLVEALQDKQITVGEPYFTRLGVPIGIALLFLMSVGPVLPWRATSGQVLRDRLVDPGVGRRDRARCRAGRRRARCRERRRVRARRLRAHEHRSFGRRRGPCAAAGNVGVAPDCRGAHRALEPAALRRAARARRSGRRRDRARDHRRLHDEARGAALARRIGTRAGLHDHVPRPRDRPVGAEDHHQGTRERERRRRARARDLHVPERGRGHRHAVDPHDAVARHLPDAGLVADVGPGDDRRPGRDDGDVPVDRRADHGARLRARARSRAQAQMCSARALGDATDDDRAPVPLAGTRT